MTKGKGENARKNTKYGRQFSYYKREGKRPVTQTGRHGYQRTNIGFESYFDAPNSYAWQERAAIGSRSGDPHFNSAHSRNPAPPNNPSNTIVLDLVDDNNVLHDKVRAQRHPRVPSVRARDGVTDANLNQQRIDSQIVLRLERAPADHNTFQHAAIPRARNGNETTWKSYNATEKGLLYCDEINYKASGLLIIRRSPRTHFLEALFCLEQRSTREKGNRGPQWHLPGGKREPGETRAEHTCCREFWEETGELLEVPHIERAIDESKMIWFGPGKYVLFVNHLPQENMAWDQIPYKFRELLQSRSSKLRESKCHGFAWLPLRDIMQNYGFSLRRYGEKFYPSQMLSQILATDPFQTLWRGFER